MVGITKRIVSMQTSQLCGLAVEVPVGSLPELITIPVQHGL